MQEFGTIIDNYLKKITNMKQFVSLFAALLCFCSVNACMKKSPVTSELTIIVMDTTQALLPEAKVKIGQEEFLTSFDGRVVLKPEQIKSNTLVASCKGYKDAKIKHLEQRVNAGNVLILSLIPEPVKEKDGSHHYALGSARSGATLMYARTLEKSGEMAAMDAMPMAEMAVGDVMHPSVPPMVSNEVVTAGKLTAGEVNDFAKWNFWLNVLDGSHKQFADQWKIAPRHRYTVQVTDKHGYAIASRAVSLLDNAGNTIFQAVTDNTGKAELWYQLLGNHLCGKHTDFYIRVDDQKQVAKDWYEGINAFVLDEECPNSQSSIVNYQLSNDVDVVFVFDATGSMGDELRYLQEEMKDVIARAKEATGGLNIRTGAVVYRDHGDEYLTRISRLTEDIRTTQTFIDKQEANGGGDYPEAMPEALMAALNSAGWDSEARARIAFLILDAPCHNDSASIALLHDQLLNAASMGVRIVPVVCSGLGESGELLVRAMALATNGTSFFLTDDSGIGHTHLKPTTDSLKVEHLNDMLVRTIAEFSIMHDCTGHWSQEEENWETDFVPNPFEIKDLTEEERQLKDSRTTLYLVDVTGKLIYVYNGRLEDAGESQIAHLPLPMLSTGVYIVKAFYDGEWHAKKIFIH